MWNGKNKAVTFSFDDGVKQDIRLIEILNEYGLKATFNLNSGKLGCIETVEYKGKSVSRDKVSPVSLRKIYEGHEIAVHTLSHPNLTTLDDDAVAYQVEKDREILSELCGYEVVGMAYPCGGVNNDERVAEIIKKHTGVKFSRTITSTYNFDLQDDLYRFNPSVYWAEYDRMIELAEKFTELKTDAPQLFYIWGHSYELDFADCIDWKGFEKLCKILSGKSDIYYATNSQVLL